MLEDDRAQIVRELPSHPVCEEAQNIVLIDYIDEHYGELLETLGAEKVDAICRQARQELKRIFLDRILSEKDEERAIALRQDKMLTDYINQNYDRLIEVFYHERAVNKPMDQVLDFMFRQLEGHLEDLAHAMEYGKQIQSREMFKDTTASRLGWVEPVQDGYYEAKDEEGNVKNVHEKVVLKPTDEGTRVYHEYYHQPLNTDDDKIPSVLNVDSGVQSGLRKAI